MSGLNVTTAVAERYSSAAGAREEALCCPVNYDRKYLEAIPTEIVERDYGCGDPSTHLAQGEVVLDLGSGAGKICFIASQVVGAEGRVIGVDMNAEMLKLARTGAPVVADNIGYSNVEFFEGKIEDLRYDPAAVASFLSQNPVTDSQGALALEAFVARQRGERPLIADESVDVVVSNCVLNLVGDIDKPKLFDEIYRVTKTGGRVVISDIVGDEDVPLHMREDAELWSGCISGALREDAFVEAFVQAGFHGVRILSRDVEPWRTVEGIEFRSLTVEAFKGKEGVCLERNQAVVYKGPFSQVTDDDGHVIRRGVRTAVCDKNFKLYMRAPYEGCFEAVAPLQEIPISEAGEFDCSRDTQRDPCETKGKAYKATSDAGSGSCC